jgi:putative addiction module component (TIGR02574 family)
MPMTKEQILNEAMALQPLDRETIAEALFSSVVYDDEMPVDSEWMSEIRRRKGEIQAGRAVLVPFEEVMARLSARGRA